MTPAQKARDTKLFKLCRILAEAMANLPSNYDGRDLIALWEQAAASKSLKAEAFLMLDNQPGRFNRYQEWHPRLRGVRNTPELGERLFNIWR